MLMDTEPVLPHVPEYTEPKNCSPNSPDINPLDYKFSLRGVVESREKCSHPSEMPFVSIINI